MKHHASIGADIITLILLLIAITGTVYAGAGVRKTWRQARRAIVVTEQEARNKDSSDDEDRGEL